MSTYIQQRVLASSSAEPPARNVLVSYDEFKQRQRLRLRVTAAFEKVQREHTIDGEFRDVTHVQDPGRGDETT
jgi:hypothetical protein